MRPLRTPLLMLRQRPLQLILRQPRRQRFPAVPRLGVWRLILIEDGTGLIVTVMVNPNAHAQLVLRQTNLFHHQEKHRAQKVGIRLARVAQTVVGRVTRRRLTPLTEIVNAKEKVTESGLEESRGPDYGSRRSQNRLASSQPSSEPWQTESATTHLQLGLVGSI
jgi:hypothetical protein